ncbi:MAG: ABC transporter permease [Chloroflexota bacterium]
MREYTIRRILLVPLTLFLVTIFVFSVVRLLPGDVVTILLRDSDFTEEDRLRELERLGFAKPVHEQYITWMSNIFRGDMGKSLWCGRPVFGELQQKLPVTLELAALAIFFAMLMGIPIGIISAIRQDTSFDYFFRSIAIGGLSVPGFWLATMFVVFAGLWFRWIPPVRYVAFFDNPLANIQQFIMPAFLLGINFSAAMMRMTRTTMLEVLRQDYIRTAWAKGLTERVVLYRHSLKNALIPVVTILGVELAQVIGGSVIMETIFGLPGIGKFMFQVIGVRDYPAVQGINLLVASFILFINLLVDLSHGYLDPRIRFQ